MLATVAFLDSERRRHASHGPKRYVRGAYVLHFDVVGGLSMAATEQEAGGAKQRLRRRLRALSLAAAPMEFALRDTDAVFRRAILTL